MNGKLALKILDYGTRNKISRNVKCKFNLNIRIVIIEDSLLKTIILHEFFLVNLLKKFVRNNFFCYFSKNLN